MTLTLLFIRHGESAVNLTGTISNRLLDFNPLTELGRQQARSLLDSLLGRRVLSVWSSPLARARETAGILAAGFGLEPQTADGLREPDCGIAEGRSDAEAWDLHAEQEAAWKAGVLDHRIPGGESFLEVRDRFAPFVEGLAARQSAEKGTILLVSHGSVLVNMLPLVLSNVSSEFARRNPLGNCGTVEAQMFPAGLRCTKWNGEPYR